MVSPDGETRDEAALLIADDEESWEASIALAAARARMFGVAPGDAPERGAVEQWVDEGSVAATLGRYVVLEKLGRGGMGEVFRAYDPKLRREVALKILRRRDDADGSARMVREAQAMAQLRHPNVVAVYDVEHEHDPPFIAMELVDGITLRSWLRRDRRPVDEVLGVFVRAGHGLAAAHSAGLVHRDFKPQNILVDRGGRPRVLDFGLARDSGEPASGATPLNRNALDASPEITAEGTVLGTPAYMAPEQHRGERADHSSDQFAFCAALYEALAQKRPFEADTSQGLHDAKRSGAHLDVAGIPAALRPVLSRGLSFRPGDRFPSTDAMLAAVTRVGRRHKRRQRVKVAGTVLGAAGVMVVVGFQAHAWSEGRHAAQCEAAADAITATWGPELRAELDAKFKATGAPYAPDVARTTVRYLDAYAAKWRDAFAAACAASTQTATAFEEPCLAARQLELQTLVEHLQGNEEGTVRAAGSAAAALTPVAICSSPATPRYMTATEDGRRAQRALYSALAMRGTRHHAQSRQSLEAALASTPAPTGLVLARLQRELGTTLADLGEYDQAIDVLEKAYFAAHAEHGFDVAVGATASLAYAYVRLRELDAAERWLAHGQVVVGEHTVSQRATLWLMSEQAAVAQRQGRFTEAAERYAAVMELRRQEFGPDSAAVSAALHNIATAKIAMGHLDGAEALFNEALANQRARLGSMHPSVALTVNNLGTVHSLRGLHARSEQAYREALAIYRANDDSDPLLVASSLLPLGLARYYKGDYEEAWAMLDEARGSTTDAYGPQHPLAVATRVALGMVHAARGEDESARMLFEGTAAAYESFEGGGRLDLAQVLASFGMFELDRGDPAAAGPKFTRALEITGGLRPASPASAAATIGLAELALAAGEDEEAITLAQSVVDSDQTPQFLAHARFVLARALWEQDEARAIRLATEARDAEWIVPAAFRQREIEAWLAAHRG